MTTVLEQNLSQEDMDEIRDNSAKKLAKRQAKYYLQCQVLDDNLLISGKKKDYWEQKFKLFVPADALTPSLCNEFDRRIIELHQEATFLFNAATMRAQYLAHDSKDEYHQRVKDLVDQYKAENKRLPSAATIDNIANLGNMDEEYNAIAGEMEVKYWKSLLEHLSTCRKIIENVSLNISVEMKAEQASNYMQRLGSKRDE